MVPGGGIEPPTRGFSIRCSTPELPGRSAGLLSLAEQVPVAGSATESPRVIAPGQHLSSGFCRGVTDKICKVLNRGCRAIHQGFQMADLDPQSCIFRPATPPNQGLNTARCKTDKRLAGSVCRIGGRGEKHEGERYCRRWARVSCLWTASRNVLGNPRPGATWSSRTAAGQPRWNRTPSI